MGGIYQHGLLSSVTGNKKPQPLSWGIIAGCGLGELNPHSMIVAHLVYPLLANPQLEVWELYNVDNHTNTSNPMCGGISPPCV